MSRKEQNVVASGTTDVWHHRPNTASRLSTTTPAAPTAPYSAASKKTLLRFRRSPIADGGEGGRRAIGWSPANKPDRSSQSCRAAPTRCLDRQRRLYKRHTAGRPAHPVTIRQPSDVISPGFSKFCENRPFVLCGSSARAGRGGRRRAICRRRFQRRLRREHSTAAGACAVFHHAASTAAAVHGASLSCATVQETFVL